MTVKPRIRLKARPHPRLSLVKSAPLSPVAQAAIDQIIEIDRGGGMVGAFVCCLLGDGHTDSAYVSEPKDARYFAPRIIGHAHTDASLMITQASDAEAI